MAADIAPASPLPANNLGDCSAPVTRAKEEQRPFAELPQAVLNRAIPDIPLTSKRSPA
ncbi:MAG: hypothetical protein Tsb0032_31380 [Kiloniellaceae bacterium]